MLKSNVFMSFEVHMRMINNITASSICRCFVHVTYLKEEHLYLHITLNEE